MKKLLALILSVTCVTMLTSCGVLNKIRDKIEHKEPEQSEVTSSPDVSSTTTIGNTTIELVL